MSETVGDAVPASQRGSWSSFLKSIASFSGDLSSLTAPPFILSPVSLTEFPAYWCEHPEVFAAIADAPNDEARVLAVLKWFIGTLKDQYTSRNESMGSEKKPLNPVLGELFYGTWPAPASNPEQGKTTLLVEQVSHHPPITAYVIENKHKGLRLTGHNAQKTSFSGESCLHLYCFWGPDFAHSSFTGGSIIVKQIGHAILTYTPPSGAPVEYLLTLPRLRIDGLWYGSPYIELTETTYIVGGGFVCTIDYKGRGYFSGKSHSFKAHVAPAPGMGGGGGAEEHIVEGTWHEKSKLIKGGSKHHPVEADGTFHDAIEEKKKEVTALGGEVDGSMGEFETRKLWSAVARGIREGDFETASREKSRIENDQRQRRRDEVAAGTTWELKHFKRVENDAVYERLARLVPKLAPATEDCYVYEENGPSGLGQ